MEKQYPGTFLKQLNCVLLRHAAKLKIISFNLSSTLDYDCCHKRVITSSQRHQVVARQPRPPSSGAHVPAERGWLHLCASYLEAANPSRSALPARRWPTYCGSEHVILRSMTLLRYCDVVLVASRRPALSITMSIRKSLSALNGAGGESTYVKTRGRARIPGDGVGRPARPNGGNLADGACLRLPHRTAPHQGHPSRQELLHPQKSTVPRTRTPTLRMAPDRSTGLALKKAVACGPDWLLFRGLCGTSRV